jgi:hypothetical protein
LSSYISSGEFAKLYEDVKLTEYLVI